MNKPNCCAKCDLDADQRRWLKIETGVTSVCSRCECHFPAPTNKETTPGWEEEFDSLFPLPKFLALSGGKGVERDKMITYIRSLLATATAEARRQERSPWLMAIGHLNLRERESVIATEKQVRSELEAARHSNGE